jgi:imidazoleglycerol-phosphate dehydratase
MPTLWRFGLSKDARSAVIERKSKETRLTARVKLDGSGRVKVATGLPFLDHMVEQAARYAGTDLTLRGSGDLHVDAHHLVEDAGIVLGQALSAALGERAGIARFGSAYAPLDEALARVVVDLGKRPFLSYNVPLRGRIGTVESEVLEEFWKALSTHLGATIHVDLIRGRNRHHVAEATFKALGLALRAAMVEGGGPAMPSSKGLLG